MGKNEGKGRNGKQAKQQLADGLAKSDQSQLPGKQDVVLSAQTIPTCEVDSLANRYNWKWMGLPHSTQTGRAGLGWVALREFWSKASERQLKTMVVALPHKGDIPGQSGSLDAMGGYGAEAH